MFRLFDRKEVTSELAPLPALALAGKLSSIGSGSIDRSRWLDRLLFTLAGYILAGFLLPDTIFDRQWSLHRYLIIWTQAGQVGVAAVVITIVAAISVCLSYLYAIRPGGQLLWWAILGFLCVYFVAAVNGISQLHGDSQHSVLLLACVTTGLLCARCCSTRARSISLFVTLGVVQSIYAIVLYASGNDSFVSGDVIRAGGTFHNPSTLYKCLMVCGALAVPLAVSKTARLRQGAWIACSVVLLIALLLTWYRAAFLCLAVSLTWFLWRARGIRVASVVLIALVFIFAGVTYVRQHGSENSQSAMRSVESRQAIWHGAWDVFLKNPLFGVGATRFELMTRVQKSGHVYLVSAIHPLNTYLYYLDELGLLGALLIGALIGGIVLSINSQRSLLANAVGAAWITVMVSSLFDTYFGPSIWAYSTNNAMFGVLLGITLLPDSRSVARSSAISTVHPPTLLQRTLI